MKAVFITYDGLTDTLGRSQILPYIEGLTQVSHEYTIISSEKKEKFLESGAEVKTHLKKMGINWIPTQYTKNPPLLSTVKDIKNLREKLRLLIRKEKIELIHCRSYVSMFVAYRVAKKNNIKILFDMRGFWIDERIDGEIWDLKNPIMHSLFKYLKKQEIIWFKNADRIISLTEAGKTLIEKEFEVKGNKIDVIPCCADESFFDPSKIDLLSKSRIKKELGISENEKVLTYSGSLGTWYLADEMMMQFKRLKEAGIVDKFLWITPEKADFLHKKASELRINPSSILVKSCKREEMPLYLSLSDLGIFYIKAAFSKIASSPTKLGEMLQMGIPVICNSGVGDLKDFFNENKVGICHSLVDIDKLDNTKVANLLNLKKSEIREVGIRELGLTSGIEKYSKTLKSLS